jgi:hypothetical protein
MVKGADLERRALGDPASFAAMAAALGALAVCARWWTSASAKSPESELRFEEEPTPAILLWICTATARRRSEPGQAK